MKHSFNNFITVVKELLTDVLDAIQDKSNWPYFFALILSSFLISTIITKLHNPDFVIGLFVGVVAVSLVILFKE